MIMNILLFGQLADAAGAKVLQVNAAGDTDELIRHIELVCPPLRGLTYIVAVNRDVIQSNTKLTSDAEIALLPPYSGG
jgi:molybdopterin synthase sulfur carrier subunit